MTKKNDADKRKRESKLVEELSVKHGYAFCKLRHKADQHTSYFTHDKKTGKVAIEPAVCIKLIIPVNSALGIMVTALYKEHDKRRKR